MKRKIMVRDKDGVKEKEISYIPGRFILAILITLFEILAIIAIVVALCIYVPYFYILAYATQIACVLRIIASDDNPDYKVPWLLFVLILPVSGFMLYFLFYSRKLPKKHIKKIDELRKKTYIKQEKREFESLKEVDSVASSHAQMLCNIAETHLFYGKTQRYFASGEELFASMIEDLKKAKKFIFMEYFIIEEGALWTSILKILKEKVAQGVEVKIVYDDVGCMKTLPSNYAKTLRKYGIQATVFARLKGQANNEFNSRSHRKITVIDGVVGYTGGANIADEYINKKRTLGHWKDSGIRIEGEAVHELTELFLGDYSFNVKTFPEPENDYYPTVDNHEVDGYLIPFGDGPNPLYKTRVSKNVVQNMLSLATEYAYITTPYLIIDNDLCNSLENAALRGVNVKIILPHVPDKKMVFWITQSYYKRLMKAGVEIYEYTPGFMHAKNYVVDGKYAMVGSVNLDYRSLAHHFENAVWLYECECIKDIKRDIDKTLENCIRIKEDTRKNGVIKSFIRAIIKIFAPLM